jgi:GT2 family glycosyltransferase
MNNRKSIAILLTCFNRKAKTLACLESLKTICPSGDVYLVDDASTDGTSEAVSRLFPEVTIIKGNGNLFWNRGMHLAWQVAAQKKNDFYLWLNDDVVLFPGALDELFACSQIQNNSAIISGLIESSLDGTVIYGGTDSFRRLIQPNGKLNQISHLNGNVVLIPDTVFTKLGNFDPVFHHDLGDVDYGFRAVKKGIGVYTTRVSVASGEPNQICRVRKNGVSMKDRFKNLYAPLGSHPRINFYFRRKHFGILNASFYFVFLHFLNLLPDSLNQFFFKDRYIA